MFATQFQLLVDSNVWCVTHSMCERKTTDRNCITRKHTHTHTLTPMGPTYILILMLVYSCSLTTRYCAFHSNIFLMFSMDRHLCFFLFFLVFLLFCFFFWLYIILVALDVPVFEHRILLKYTLFSVTCVESSFICVL